MDRARFYAALRKRDSGLFGTSLSQSQVVLCFGAAPLFGLALLFLTSTGHVSALADSLTGLANSRPTRTYV